MSLKGEWPLGQNEIGQRERQRPAQDPEGAGRVGFGPFLYDLELATLRRDDREIELPLRCLMVLERLLRSAGGTVSRDELLDVVWRGDFVTDTSLTEAVSRLRQALGDEARRPCYIQTIHGRGYKFIAPIDRRATAPKAASPEGPPLDRSSTDRSPTTETAKFAGPATVFRTPKSTRWRVAGALLLAGFLAWFGTPPFQTPPSATPAEVATKVLEDAQRGRERPLVRLAEVTLAGEAPKDYGFPPLPLEDLSVDPVGGRLAFSMAGDQGPEIWMLQPQRGTLQRIASGGHFSDPVWTLDGRGLALAHNRGDSIDLMFGEPGSGRQMEVLLEAPHDQFPESWSSDGRSLVYSELHPETGFDLWILRQQEAGRWLPEPLVRTDEHEAFGALSPDGGHVAYVTQGDDGPEVFVLLLGRPQSPVRVSRNGGHSPFWSSAGDRLHYLQAGRVWTVDADRLVAGAPPAAGRSTAVSGVFLATVSSATDRLVVAVLDGDPGRD